MITARQNNDEKHRQKCKADLTIEHCYCTLCSVVLAAAAVASTASKAA